MASRLLLIHDLSGKAHYINIEKIIFVTAGKPKTTEVTVEGAKVITTIKPIEEVVGDINSILKE